jgi:hypothetical protein
MPFLPRNGYSRKDLHPLLFHFARQWESDLAQAGIAPRDAEKRLAGFHSLRVTFVTNLQRAGLPPRVVMALARHTDWRLTSGTYTDLTVLDIFGAATALPDYPETKPQRMLREGTHDAPETRDQIRDQKGSADEHSHARHCPAGGSSIRDGDSEKTLETQEILPFSGRKSVRGNCGQVNSPSRTRTYNNPVNSRVLYH